MLLPGDDDQRCQPWIFRNQGGILSVDRNLGVREGFRLRLFEAEFEVEEGLSMTIFREGDRDRIYGRFLSKNR